MWDGIGTFEECYKEFDYLRTAEKIASIFGFQSTATYQRLQKTKQAKKNYSSEFVGKKCCFAMFLSMDLRLFEFLWPTAMMKFKSGK